MPLIEELPTSDPPTPTLGGRVWLSIGRLLTTGIGSAVAVSLLLAMNGALAGAHARVARGEAVAAESARPHPYSSQIPFATASPGDVNALLARPLYLPPIAADASCPVTYSSDPSIGLASARGGPHFFLGGPSPKGGEPLNKMAFILRNSSGPVLVRGIRIDAAGAGRLEFTGEMADPLGGDTATSSSGSRYTFYAGVVVRHAPDAFYVYPSTPGCYAMQIDGPDFQDIVVLNAS